MVRDARPNLSPVRPVTLASLTLARDVGPVTLASDIGQTLAVTLVSGVGALP